MTNWETDFREDTESKSMKTKESTEGFFFFFEEAMNAPWEKDH